jgi:hypothetical protein
MIFGIWPGVVAADLVDLHPVDCPPENPAATLAALRDLQGDADRFYVRCYRHFGTGNRAAAALAPAPHQPGLYAGQGRLIDLVACYQSQVADPAGFARYVRQAVRDVAGWGGGKVQVGEELNVGAPLDGGSPGCFEAVAAGVAAALDERDQLGAAVDVGINAAGMPEPAFWRRMADALGSDLLGRLDYVGLDAFPDVFRPIPHPDLPRAVCGLVTAFRTITSDVGIPASTPIHITETGWPTDERHDESTQASVLATVATAVMDAHVGVTAYELFGLRDGLTAGNRNTRFGLVRDDYSRKPAFDAVRRLMAESRDDRQPADARCRR